MGTFTLISFGFYVAMNALVPVWLQKPVAEGGYGFSLEQNAAFTFCHWIGILLVQIVGHYLNDKIPLAIARRRNGGAWSISGPFTSAVRRPGRRGSRRACESR